MAFFVAIRNSFARKDFGVQHTSQARIIVEVSIPFFVFLSGFDRRNLRNRLFRATDYGLPSASLESCGETFDSQC